MEKKNTKLDTVTVGSLWGGTVGALVGTAGGVLVGALIPDPVVGWTVASVATILGANAGAIVGGKIAQGVALLKGLSQNTKEKELQ